VQQLGHCGGDRRAKQGDGEDHEHELAQAAAAAAVGVGLLLGRVFRRSSQVREALDAQERETPAERQEPPQEGPRVA
jgi:hypothetical protein